MSITSKIQTIIDCKDAIKTAINDKGGTITDATPLSEYATAIYNLPSDVITIVPLDTAITALTAEVNNYYRFGFDVGELAVTLPTVSDATTLLNVVLYLSTGTSPQITFTSSHNVAYQKDFAVEADKTYEINCLFNGVSWVLAAVEIDLT